MPEEVQEEVVDRGDNIPEPKAEAKAEEPTKAEAEVPTKEEPAQVDSGKMVPLTRFQAQNIRLREQEKANQELQARLAELEKAPAPAAKEEASTVRDFAAEAAEVEKQLDAAIADNDIAAVAKANRELRAIDRAETEQRFTQAQEPAKQLQQSIAMREFNETLEAVEAEYPELNPDNETASRVKIDAAQAMVAAFEAQGYSSSDALIKAVAVLYPEAPETPVAPAASATPRGIKDKIAAAAATPPNLNRAGGENSDVAGIQSEINPAQLSDKEFDDLPEAVKKRLRGDIAA